jgi:penicillin-binding protein 2
MITAEDRVKLRASLLGLIALGLLAMLLARLWFLQVLTGEQYAVAAQRNHVRLIAVEAPRGRILDRNGRVIVKNRPSLSIAVRRDDFTNPRRVLPRLSKLLGIPVNTIKHSLADKRTSPYKPVVIAEDVDPNVVFQIRERQDEYPGVESVTLPVRVYPLGSLASHEIGYVGETNETELKRLRTRGYRLGDQIGRAGIERSYENDLRGRPGLDKLEVNAQGIVLRSLGHQDPVSGNDIRLTLDVDVQKIAEDAVRLGILRARSKEFRETGELFRAPAGAAVVLDAKTGEIVASASYPGYDPSKFVGGVDPEYFAYLNDPKNNFPLLNRAIQSGYPPGSTFKPFMAAAALSSGVATASGGYPCTSQFVFGNRPFRNWRPENETISLSEALVQSCDTVFYRFGAEWWRRDQNDVNAGRKPDELMQRWARRFGLGKSTGVDVPNEDPGRVPDRASKKTQWERNRAFWCKEGRAGNAVYEDLCRYGSVWRGGDSVNMSIGQGDITVTPLQLAVGYAAVANGGSVLRPHFGMSVWSPSGRMLRQIRTRVVSRAGLSSSYMEYIQRALARVATHGTAQFPFAGWPLDDLPVAAKTGSAEIAGKQPFSWFAAYAPAFNPKYVVVSVVEEAGFGSQVAGPVVRRIMDKLFDRPLTPIEFGVRSD